MVKKNLIKELKLEKEITTIEPHPEVIRWSDAHSLIGDFSYDEVEGHETPEAITIGIVIYENKEKVALCQTQFLNVDVEDKCFRRVMYIPKVMIRERHKLKTTKRSKK